MTKSKCQIKSQIQKIIKILNFGIYLSLRFGISCLVDPNERGLKPYVQKAVTGRVRARSSGAVCHFTASDSRTACSWDTHWGVLDVDGGAAIQLSGLILGKTLNPVMVRRS